MAAPAFGFSVGDFLSAIKDDDAGKDLVKKVGRALKKTGGASAEYQQAVIELKGLKHALRHLEALEPDRDNEKHVNAIRGMALTCQYPLREFLTKLEAYEKSLGPFSDSRWYRAIPQKSKWAATFAEEVDKFRALIATKTTSINLLLSLNISKSISGMETRLKTHRDKEHSELLAKAAEHRADLHTINRRMIDIEDRMDDQMEHSKVTHEAYSKDIRLISTKLISLRDTGQQILRFLSTFPLEMRDLLLKILQINWQIYRTLLTIQQSLLHPPTGLLSSNIRFEDAMGELRELPFEYFRHWEPFEGFLRAHFKNKPGIDNVIEGRYHILDDDRRGVVIRQEHWTRSINPGQRLAMSMVISQLERIREQCPRPNCTGTRFNRCLKTGLSQCMTCSLKLFPKDGDLANSIDSIDLLDEDERITQRQIEEDNRIYGNRPEPSDAVEAGESELYERMFVRLPPKKSASDFDSELENRQKARKIYDGSMIDRENTTAVQWNSGESPLSAWLSQSAIPTTIQAPESSVDHHNNINSKDEVIMSRERKDIEFFKRIHIGSVAGNESPDRSRETDDVLGLESDAQIYYRNIRDRFPLLPVYLIRRLAVANQYRSRRLQSMRQLGGCSLEISSPWSSWMDIQLAATRSGSLQLLCSQNPVKDQVGDLHPVKTYKYPKPVCRNCRTSTALMWFRDESGFVLCSDCGSFRKKHGYSRPLDAELYPEAWEPFLPPPQTTPGCPEHLNSHFYHSCEKCGQQLDTLDSGRRHLQGCGHNSRQPFECGFISCKARFDIDSVPKLHPGGLGFRYNSSARQERQDAEHGQDFWTGRQTRRRSSSVRSKESSVNSSLHGSEEMDLNYQLPSPKLGSESSGSNRNLFRAPVDLPSRFDKTEKQRSFDCEICGLIVQVNRRRDWQRHVMRDLRPYVCTFENCLEDPGEQFYSIKDCLSHEVCSHEAGNNHSLRHYQRNAVGGKCLFCKKPIKTSGTGRTSLVGHMAKHMEEIAFIVVPQAYEDWDFYSESSLSSSSSRDSNHSYFCGLTGAYICALTSKRKSKKESRGN